MYYINHDEIYYINHDEMYYMNNNEMYYLSISAMIMKCITSTRMIKCQYIRRVFISTMTKWKYILKLNIKKMHVVNKP